MAKFDGIFEIQGTLKGMTFYKTKNGSFIRTKGGVSKKRIMNDPAFARTRENGTEFTHIAQAGQLVRKSTGNFYKLAKDGKVVSRMVKVLSRIKQLDITSARGSRNVGVALSEIAGKALLKGFDFNVNSKFNYVLRVNYELDPVTGTLSVPQLIPQEDLYYPEGATHVKMSCAASRIDFETATYETTYSDAVQIALNMTDTPISLAPASIPGGTGFLFYYVLIEFQQEINGVFYPLKNNAFNVLHILDVIE